MKASYSIYVKTKNESLEVYHYYTNKGYRFNGNESSKDVVEILIMGTWVFCFNIDENRREYSITIGARWGIEYNINDFRNKIKGAPPPNIK